MNQNDFVMSDHRSYLLDLNVEEYFEDYLSSWNRINKAVLNLSRESHRATFYEELVNQLNIYNIEESLMKTSLSNQEIENIDEVVTRMLNEARKKVEGQLCNIPYSDEKIKQLGMLMFWKAKVRQLKGIPVDNEVLEKRIELHNIKVSVDISLDQASEKLVMAKNHWLSLKKEGERIKRKIFA